MMHLMRQNHLEWSPQAQQVACHRVVQINLLYLGMALEPPGTSFLGDIEIWFARQCWTDWHLGCMGWSAYWSIHGVLSVYRFLEGVQCNTHSTYNIKCLPSTIHLSIQGNTFDETSQVDSWAAKGVDQRTFGPVATPQPMKKSPKVIPVGSVDECEAVLPREASNRLPCKNSVKQHKQ